MTDITDISTLRFIPIMFTSLFSNTGRRNRVLDESHRLMNRDIFINQSTYVVGPHDVELQDGCWCWHHYKKVVPPRTTPLGHTATRVTPQCGSLLSTVRSASFLVLTTGSTYGLFTADMESQTFVPILIPTPL